MRNFESSPIFHKPIIKYIFILIIAVFYLPLYGQSQTSFEKMGANTPNYKVIERIVKSKRLKLQKYYGSTWKSGNYRGAWQRVMQYFPKNFQYNSSTKNFMHHWFNPKGKLEIAVYQSHELKKAVKNLETFHDHSIVRAYKAMRDKKEQTEADAFKNKLGPLEKYFLDKESKKLLKKYLKGEKSISKEARGIYNEMLKTLKEEGDHMFAAALLHEGLHSKIDNDQKVAQIHNDFKSCKTPVQWDEFRSYMAEIGYHANYYKYAMEKINAHMNRIKALLKELEKFRKLKKPISDKDKAKIERIKAKIKAHMVIIRVHLREIQQSLDRMKGLMDYFKKNYFKADNPKNYKNFDEIKQLIDQVDNKINDFTNKAQKAINDLNKALKDLKDMLDAWNVWASCQTPIPPTEEKHKEVIKKFEDVSIPSIPSTEDEKKVGERNIRSTGNRRSRIEISQGPSQKDSIQEKKKKLSDIKSPYTHPFSISAGVDRSTFKMDKLNDYFNYLNQTWEGDISSIENSIGYWLSINYKIFSNFDIGFGHNHFKEQVTSVLNSTSNTYTNEVTLNTIELTVNYYFNITSNLNAFAHLGAGPYWSTYQETEGTFSIEGKANTFGYIVGSGLEVNLSNKFAITGQVGFRQAKFDSYDNNIQFFQPDDTNVELDFSGIYVRLGLKYRF